MLKFLRTYKKFVVAIILCYIYMICVLVVPTNKSTTIPGGITPINENIVIENTNKANNFYSIYVSSYRPLTVFQKWVLEQSSESSIDDITEYQSHLSLLDEYYMGQISKKASFQYSLIYAYEYARDYQIKTMSSSDINITYNLMGLRVYYKPLRISNVSINDLVIGITILDTYYDILTLSNSELQKVIDDTLKINQPMKLAIKRNEEIVNVDFSYEKGDYSFMFYPEYNISNAFPKFAITNQNGNIGGPSGGLLQTLSIYSALLNLNYGLAIIAGTGTIEFDGSIGKIGGQDQKVYTAINNNVDYFMITKENVATNASINYLVNGKFASSNENGELEKVEHNFKDFKVIENISDALEYLHEIAI